MKNGLLNGSTAALAVMTMASASMNFLLARQRIIRLMPMSPAPNTGYIWRRVFLSRRHRGRETKAVTQAGLRKSRSD